MADIRYRIQQAHGGEIREIPDGAWPFFQNQGYVILSTIGAPPDYALPALPVVHGSDADALRPMTAQPVVWYGSVEPVNLDVDLGDEWVTSGALNDAGVAGLVGNGASATAVALRAALVPRWKASTAYLANDIVMSPSGQLVQAKANFTSSGSFNAANWNQLTQAAGNYTVVVNHGATASTARPATTGAVLWIGSVQPTNWIDGDAWDDTSS